MVEATAEPKAAPQEQKPLTETKTESKPEEKPVQKKGSPSAESKPTVAIPPPKAEGTQKQPTTPTVTSPTPPQSPASVSTQSTPMTATKDLSAVHEVPSTPPAGAQKAPKKEAPKKKK